MFCKNCGTQMENGEKFCPNCGTIQNDISVEREGNQPKPNTKKKSKGKKGVIIVALLLVVAIVFSIIAFPKIKDALTIPENSIVCYIKDGELYVNFSDDLTSYKLTKKMSVNNLEDSENRAVERKAASYTRYCQEANRIFFLDRIDTNEIGVNLYYANLNDVKKETFELVKIDSQIDLESYKITKDGNKVYYLNTEECFYCSDLETKTKIADKVSYFYMNSDASIVLYVTHTDDDVFTLYSVDKDGNSKEIAKDIRVSYTSDDYSVLCYRQANTLYLLTNGTTIKALFDFENEDDTANVYYADAESNVYYIKNNDTEYPKASEYVNDDLAEKDATIIEPDKTNQIYWESWTTVSQGDEIINQYARSYTDEYYNLLEEYEQKVERDKLREELKEQDLHISTRSLYYYNGKESKKISENVNYDISHYSDTIIFSRQNFKNSEKVKFSEICSTIEEYSPYEARSYILEQTTANNTYCVVINNELHEIVTGTNVDLKFNAEYSFICYVEKKDDICGDLYKINIKENGLSKPEKLYDMVGMYQCIGEDIVYYRDPIAIEADDETVLYSSDLYVNNDRIDTDVLSYKGNYPVATYLTGGVFYYYNINDYSLDEVSWTLNQYYNKETKTIGTDIGGLVTMGVDRNYIIDNYNKSSYLGELKFITEDETIIIASDVSYVFHPIVV